MLESLGYASSNDVFPVYIGDDQTDEDAFKVLRKRGQGFGILVSKVSKETDASYCLQEPSEVMFFLQRLVAWKLRSLRRGHKGQQEKGQTAVEMLLYGSGMAHLVRKEC